jgi:tetratricopeptide (TPR) repeat protein
LSDTLERAIRLREAGELEEARDVLLKLLERNPEDPAVNYQCAWVHDRMGLEREAIPLYERAIERGLSGGDLEGAILSLGSSYRAVGNPAKAAEVLRGGVARFPHNRAMQVFLAMALHDLDEHVQAMEILLRNLAETSSDPEISAYKEALSYYANRLNEPRSPR